jgi:antitoxin CptB
MTPGNLGELRWRCRRGMKELDILLQRYVEQRFCSAPAGEQAAFRQLLEVQDPLIYGYCLGSSRPPEHFVALVARITAEPSAVR